MKPLEFGLKLTALFVEWSTADSNIKTNSIDYYYYLTRYTPAWKVRPAVVDSLYKLKNNPLWRATGKDRKHIFSFQS